ncbi:MAG: hypothetical protein H6828_08860 [Planctomycetes bacterium]|nr:hypothetical protein [Planctomycetota bacterium]
MRYLACLTLSVALAPLATAQVHRADFDLVPEGGVGAVYSEDGLVFSNLDRYLGSSSEPFTIEDATNQITGVAGFTPPNALGFGGYSPGPSAAWSRCGAFDIGVPGVFDQAVLHLQVTGSSGGNAVALQALSGGVVVASDTFALPTSFGPHAVALTISGVAFDALHVVGTGGANSGAFFAIVDAVEVGAQQAGQPFCFGDGSGTQCPCGNPGGSGEGCANSTGAGAELGGGGTASLAVDDFALQLEQLPATQPVLMFAGVNAVNGGLGTLFGDGLRCAGGSIQRLGVHQSSALGEASWNGGLLGGHGWSAGLTVRFQGWYRDPGGPCGTGYNLSNGVELTLQP